jgi:hypothetical protein
MKRIEWPISILAMVAILAGLPGVLHSQNVPPQLSLMGDSLVDVSRVGEYEAAVKELLAEMDQHGFPFPLHTYVTDDGHYYSVFPLKNHADADLWIEAWEKLGRTMGSQNLQALQDRIASCEIERVYQFWYFRPDISFLPGEERLKPEEIGYYTWDFVWLIPGKEAEFEACNKAWMVLSQAKKSKDPFLTYKGGLGTKMPVYVWFEYGKSAADYAVTEEEFWKTMGEEGAALSKKLRALIRRRESKTGTYRSDLSSAPKK